MSDAINGASLRTSLFTKYGQLQMWLLSRLVWYLALIYLVTLVAFAVLRLFTGISIKRIGYFNLRHIVITPKQGVEIRIGKLGLAPHRPTVARPGFVTFIVSNLEIVVDLDTIIKHDPEAEAAAVDQQREDKEASEADAEKIKQAEFVDASENPQADIKPDSTGRRESASSSSQQGSDKRPDLRGIPIVPKGSHAFKILRWIVQTLRVFDFQLVSTAIAFTGLNSAIATAINLRVDMRKTRNVKVSNFKGTLDTYKLGESELPLSAKFHITEVYTADSLEDESPWQVFEDFMFDIYGVLDLNEMCVKELGAQLHAGRFQLDVAHILGLLDKVKEMRQKKIPKEEQVRVRKEEEKIEEEASEEKAKNANTKVLSAQDRQRMLKGAMTLLHLVNRLQLTIGAFEVLRVPILRHDSDPVFMAVSMKDFNLDLSRMNPLSSGFRLLYDEGDVAHQAILTVASFTAGLDNGSEQEEILYVPMLTSLSRGNIFAKTLRFVQDDNKNTRNESTVRSRWSLHSPNLSIEQSQISTIMRVILGHAAQSATKKRKQGPHYEAETHSDTEEARILKSGKINIPFAKSLPKLDIDFTISDPALRLVCNGMPGCEDAMFVSSCQRMYTSLTARHYPETSTYGAQLTFETTENQIWYRSASVPRFDVSESESAHLAIKARTTPYLEVELDGSHTGFHITALHHEIFFAIGMLQLTISQPIRAFRKEFPKPKAPPSDDSDFPEQQVKVGPLRKIPSSIVRMRFVANNSSASMATDRFRDQENEIMGLMFSADHIEVVYETKLRAMNVHTSTDGRRVLITGNKLGLFKLDKMFLNSRRRDEGLIARNTILGIPTLTSSITTHSSFISAIQFSVTPRLRLALNINLILAYSVVREALDLARGRHHDLGKDAENLESLPQELSPEKKKEEQTNTHGEVYTTEALLARALIKIDLPSDDQVMLELCSARVISDWVSNPTLQAKSLRMFSEHPFQRGAWCVIMSLINMKGEFNILYPEIRDKINLDLDGLRINIPYKFKLYRIIDNGITLTKAIKTLLLQTKKLDTKLVLDPKVIKGVPNVARTRIRAKQFLISLEDDYFESDLTLIMLTQQQCAESRRNKTYAFDRKIKSLLRKGFEQITARETSNRAEQYHRHAHSSSETKIPDGRQRVSPDKTQNLNGNGSNGNGSDSNAGSGNGYPREHSHADTKMQPTASGVHPAHNNGSSDSSGLHSFSAVHDRVDHVAAGIRHRATNVFTDFHHPSGHADTRKKDEGDVALQKALQSVPKAKIEALLVNGLELGTPADDNDEVLSQVPWLEFWASPIWEQFRQLPVPLENGELSKMSIEQARFALLEDFDRMWIDAITQARMTQHFGAQRTRNEVVVDEMDPDTCREEKIVGYSEKPMLLAVDFRKLDMTIAKTEHGTKEQLHKYLYEIGKGLPMDTEFSILVPLYIDLKAYEGLNVKLKDFPLPVLNFPPLARNQDPTTHCALRIKGNLIITEQLMHMKQMIRRLFVPLKPLIKAEKTKVGPDVLEVHRTLTPIKTFTDLHVKVESSYPSRVCWCYAYKPGFHGVGEGFSGFSKPPIDPSPVLGFWDKVRLTFHARLDFDMPKSPLCLMMKAGKSPYTLLNDDSGFIFAWKNNTKVQINPNDDPRSLFVFTSDKFQLIVPDYMKSENDYLHASPWMRSFPIRPNFENIGQPEKIVFDLSQQTTWKLGMIFEKPEAEPRFFNGRNWLRARDSDFRPHYDVKLSMPEYIKDVEHYDAYRGFRSYFIHMAISVVSTPVSVSNDIPFCSGEDPGTGPKNRCYLSPGVMHHFKAWKDQFRSEQWPPIKTGSMFPDPVRVRSNNRTFGSALSTAQYQIALTPLDIGFFHQMSSHKMSQNHLRSTGLKGKIDSFVFDWHTRREPPNPSKLGVHLHGQRRWRMRSYVGEVDIKNVSVRVVEAKLRVQNTKTALKALHADDDYDDSEDETDEGSSTTGESSTSYENSSFVTGQGSRRFYGPRHIAQDYWIDVHDYVEVGQRQRNNSRVSNVKVLPFFYAPRFGYLRRTDFSTSAVHIDSDTGEVVQKFGDIIVHDCKLSSERPDRIHATMLAGRRGDLKLRIGDIQASLESLDEKSQNADIRRRAKHLRELLAIGNMNISVLTNQIEEFEKRAKLEDRRMDNIKDAIKHDLESYVYTDKEKARVDEEFQGEHAEKEFSGYQGVYEGEGGEYDDGLNTFINRFILHSVHLKWDNDVRDILVRMKVSWSERKELEYVRLRRAVQYLEDLVQKAEDQKKRSEENSEAQDALFAKKMSSQRRYVECEGEEEGEQRLETLFDRLQAVDEGQDAQRDHSVVFMTPRIQLISNEDPTKCLQLLAREIEGQVVDTYSEIGSTEVDDKIERRYGVVLKQARFFVISEEDVQQTGVEALCLEQYSGEENENKSLWPPWLGLELCYDAKPLQNFMVMHGVSFGIRYDQPNELHVSSRDEGKDTNETVMNDSSGFSTDTEAQAEAEISDNPGNRKQSKADLRVNAEMNMHGKQKNKSLLANIIVDAPQLVVSLDSQQFFTLYMIVVDLLSYQDPLVKRREDAINRVYLMSDFSGEFRPSLKPIELLQKDIRRLYTLQQQLQVKLLHETEQSTTERIHLMRLERQIVKRTTQLMVLMRAFKSAMRKNLDTDVQMLTRFSLLADAFVIRILSEAGDPILEAFLHRVHFSRLTGESGNLNHLTISGMYARNLLHNAVYPQVLASYDDKEVCQDATNEALRIRWTMLDPVGGIPVLEGVDVVLKPLHIQLDQTMADKLMDFAFPVKQTHEADNKKKQQKGENEDPDEAYSSESDEHSIASSELTLSGDDASDIREQHQRNKRHSKHRGLLHRILPGKHSDEAEVDQMMDRASNYMSIRSLQIHPTKLMVSYKGRSHHNLLDLQNLVIPMKLIKYENKMWTRLDIVVHLRSEVIKTLLGQSGSIMSNRLRRHKSHTAQDDRDLGLDRLLSERSAEMADMLEGTKHDINTKTSDHENNPSVNDSDVKAVSDDRMLILIPEHRRKALEHPDAPSQRELSQHNKHHIHLGHHRISGEAKRDGSVARHVSNTSHAESAAASARGNHVASKGPVSPRHSSTFKGFDTSRIDHQPGSPGQLRKPHKTQTTGSFFGRKTKEPKEDDAASEMSMPSSMKSSHNIFGKLKKQFS